MPTTKEVPLNLGTKRIGTAIVEIADDGVTTRVISTNITDNEAEKLIMNSTNMGGFSISKLEG